MSGGESTNETWPSSSLATPTMTTTGLVEDASEWHRWADAGPSDYVFDRIEVKAALIVAYTAVFSCCFVGNLLVILSIVLHRRMRTITNFFLANLAFADFCVSVFCIYQNLSWYLVNSWIFGELLCRMNHFVQYLSYTASVAILTMIAAERYLAIVHPIRSKHWITATRLRRAVATVWLSAGVYSAPRFFMYSTDVFPLRNGGSETICFLKRQIYNSKVYDTVNFGLCYMLPLTLITAMYSRVGTQLWRSGVGGQWRPEVEARSRRQQPREADRESQPMPERPAKKDDHEGLLKSSAAKVERSINNHVKGATGRDIRLEMRRMDGRCSPTQTTTSGGPAAATLRSRRQVVRMLVVVVINFAVCNLPYHARKLWQYWSPSYDSTSNAAILTTPITFLVLFMNSGMNPILYAFMSVNFRKAMADVITCRLWRQRRLPSRQQSYSRSTTMTTCKTGSGGNASASHVVVLEQLHIQNTGSHDLQQLVQQPPAVHSSPPVDVIEKANGHHGQQSSANV